MASRQMRDYMAGRDLHERVSSHRLREQIRALLADSEATS